MCQRTSEIGPDSRLVAQILRLAIAAVESRKGPEQPRVALRRHDGIELGKLGRGEAVVRGAPRLYIARQHPQLELLGHIELALLTRYIKARRAADDSFDPAQFAELYAVMSAQRNTRLLGTFARLNRRDGKPQYLRHQPRIWTYLTRSLAHPVLARAREWYLANVPPPVAQGVNP